MEISSPKYSPLKGNIDRSLRNLYEKTSNLRFGLDIEENPFSLSGGSCVPVLPTFPTWESTDDIYSYNILKDKGSVKRKVTFRQTITTPPSNLLSRKLLRYQTRYQTRSNNSSEESPNDDDDNDDDDNNQGNNLQIINQINHLINLLHHPQIKI